ADVGQVVQQGLVARICGLRAGEGPGPDAERAADRRRRDCVVGRAHPDTDSRALAFGDCVACLGPRWVDDADHREQREVVDQSEQVSSSVELLWVEVATRDHHYPLAGLA